MMTTMFRRRQWRERKPPTLADLVRADAFLGVQIAVTCGLLGFCLCLLVLIAVFGDRFLAIFGL